MIILEKIRAAKAAKEHCTGSARLTDEELDAIAPPPSTPAPVPGPSVLVGFKVCKGYGGPCPVAGAEPQPIGNFSMTGRTARRSLCKVCFAVRQRAYRTTEAYRAWLRDYRDRPGVAARKNAWKRRARAEGRYDG
jgi:hypothetical protein